ncbi:hypothetical protein BBJ28_00016089 [Nothophytophthora sp. Chile5]|nr:hypothetical protein BBJ28_00016089 [Nothophytophthora sp. Chile5]
MELSLSWSEGEGEGWDSASDGEQDALFDTLAGDEPEEPDEPDEHKLMASMERVMADSEALELVERASWDSEPETETEEPPAAQTLMLPLQIQVSADASNLQWSLISPCSAPSSPRVSLSPLRPSSISSPTHEQIFEPEDEPETEQVPHSEVAEQQTQEDAEQMEKDEEESDEEVAPFDPDSCWPDEMESSSCVSAAEVAPASPSPSRSNPATSDSDTDEGAEAQQQTESNTSRLRPSALPRAPRWRRPKARTCSGSGSAGLSASSAFASLKSRARTLSRSRQQSGDDLEEEDDGDFSSDDEGYTPELHRRRVSEVEPFSASQWRRGRHNSSFTARRLSVSVSMSPAMMGKRLQDARNILNDGLQLLRSRSTSTVASEDSLLGSPACDEVKSAPPGLHLATSHVCASTSNNADEGDELSHDHPHHPSRQQQLRAGVSKAAGYLNAASVEAARKLKTRAGGFRAPHLPRQKTAASETEEEELELATPPPLASPTSVPATSLAS